MRRHRYQKNPDADLRNDYQITLQSTLIFALLSAIVVFNVNFDFGDGFEIVEITRDELELEEIIQTEIIETPPPPPRPPVPIEVPDDAIIDDEMLDFDAFLDLDAGFDLPPAPPIEEDDEPDFFVVVENMPEMVGGQQALYSVLRYPDIARRAGIEGRVIIQFIVDEQGIVRDPRVVRSAGGGGLDEAAIEAIQRVRFTPGMQRGRPVRVQMTQPVIFRLS